MSTSEQAPNPDPRIKQDDDNKKGNDEGPTKPGKPGNDPDQTPERETNKPPVADPKKENQPGKIGFSDQFLLF